MNDMRMNEMLCSNVKCYLQRDNICFVILDTVTSSLDAQIWTHIV